MSHIWKVIKIIKNKTKTRFCHCPLLSFYKQNQMLIFYAIHIDQVFKSTRLHMVVLTISILLEFFYFMPN
jgi:hypothetical protein